MAIPSIIVYSVGIPLAGIVLIFRNRSQLKKDHVRQRYGFLYNGYRGGLAKYWEMVLIYRKVVLIFIQMFLVQRGKIVQALVTVFLLIASVVALRYLQPYTKSYLNHLELFSLVISSLSVYFGVFFISRKTIISSEDGLAKGKVFLSLMSHRIDWPSPSRPHVRHHCDSAHLLLHFLDISLLAGVPHHDQDEVP